MSVYSADGSTLLAVGSDTTHNTASATFTAAANTAYSVLVGTVNNAGSGTYSLSINTPYQPVDLSLSSTITTVSNVTVDSAQAETYYNLQSVNNADVLAIEVDCATADVTLALFGTNTTGGAPSPRRSWPARTKSSPSISAATPTSWPLKLAQATARGLRH